MIKGDPTIESVVDGVKEIEWSIYVFIPNVCPELSLEVFRLFEAGRLQEAWAVQNRLTRFWLAMSLGSFPAPVKAAVEMRGLPAGAPRRPVAPLGAEQRATLQRELRAMGVL